METRQKIKREYSESEAAAALGLSILDLRGLVCEHILRRAGVSGDAQPETYLASEVIVLKILASQELCNSTEK